jgi:hypothetical protein
MTPDRADAPARERVLISYPKSGRTWFRYIFDLARIDVRFTHARATAWRPPPGRLVRREEAEGNTIVFLHRNPIDTAVSMFFQRTRRNHKPWSWRWIKAAARGRLPPRGLDEFLRHPGFGVERICRFNRAWLDYLVSSTDAIVVRYEDMAADPIATLTRVVRHLDPEGNHDIAALVEQSSFGRMRAVEDSGTRKAAELDLESRNPGDPDSRKVRRGKVGGYRDYLSEAEQVYFEKICQDYGLGSVAMTEANAAGAAHPV